jgi:hypothetical protein
MLINSKKSQSIIDFAIAFIAISGLIVGVARIWIWFNANYAKRQSAFQTSRLISAGPGRPYDTQQAPVDIGYTPLDLTEDWVFKGTASGTVSGVDGDEGDLGPEIVCDTECKGKCINQDDCGSSVEAFNKDCVCYKECALNCYCRDQIEPMVNIYNTQATSLRDQAKNLRANAKSMRATAEKCDDPWETCWWGSWGKTPDELRSAASQLDYTAGTLESSASKSDNRANGLTECCNKKVAEEQEQCLKAIETETACDSKCMKESQDFYIKCKEQNGEFMGQLLCPALADSKYGQCFDACVKEANAS